MISEIDIRWWCALNSAVGLADIKSVCDLGQQELKRTDPADYDKIVRTFAGMCGTPSADLSGCRTSADIWRAVGRDIVSIDVVGAGPDFRYLDLNVADTPADLIGRFDLVTNAGTTEHVFNQLNCMRVMHDLAKVRGVMAHVVPAAGFFNHGFFHYTVKFFTTLARANGYHCLDAWIGVDQQSGHIEPDIAAFLDASNHPMFKDVRGSALHPYHDGNGAEKFQAQDSGLYVFVRKNVDEPFRIPLDIP